MRRAFFIKKSCEPCLTANWAHLSDAIIYRLPSDAPGALPVETAMLSTFNCQQAPPVQCCELLLSDADRLLPANQSMPVCGTQLLGVNPSSGGYPLLIYFFGLVLWVRPNSKLGGLPSDSNAKYVYFNFYIQLYGCYIIRVNS